MPFSGYFQVLGTSTTFCLAIWTCNLRPTAIRIIVAILREGLTGLSPVSVLWPNMISIYKTRGDQ